MADERIYLNKLGEYYTDMLRQEAFIKDSPLSTQAVTMLRTCLNQRGASRDDKLAYLAWKRRISLDELKRQIALGEAKQMTQSEFIEMERKFLAEKEKQQDED